jgi:cysteine desulfurase
LGLSDNVIEGALRIGLGKFTTEEDIDQVVDILSTTVSQVRQFMLV